MHTPPSSPWRPSWFHTFQALRPEIVNVARLPQEELEFDYRASPWLPEEEDNQARLLVLVGSLVALLLSFLLHLGDFSELVFGDPNVILVGGGLSIWVAITLVLFGRTNAKAARNIVGLGFVIGALLYALYHASQSKAALVAVALLGLLLVAHLVDRLLHHTLMWLNANPFLPAGTRRIRKKLYQNRGWAKEQAEKNFADRWPGGNGEPPSAELKQLRAEELNYLRTALGRVFLVLLPYAVLPLLPHRFFGAWLTLLGPPAIAFFLLSTTLTRRFTPRYLLVVLWKAVVSYLTYERDPCPAPGVFLSPSGIRPWRFFLSILIVVTLGATIVPLVHFFPLAYEVYPRGWADAKLVSAPGGVLTNPNVVRELFTPERQSPMTGAPQRTLFTMKETIATPGSAGWYLIAWQNRRSFGYLFGALVGLAASFLLPLIAVGSVCLASAGPVLARAYAAMEETIPQTDGTEERAPEQRPDLKKWDAYLLRLKESRNEKERRLLWIGSTLWSDYPVLLEPELLGAHAYLRGDTGSGKTALGMTPLVLQLLRQNETALVIIDLKGDYAFFQTIKEEAEERGRTFKWFTNEHDRSTFVFNPVLITRTERLSLNQIAETLLEALNLAHGEGYGRSYFSRRARQWLTGVFQRHPETQSFEELYEYAGKREGIRTSQDYQDVFELLSVLESLSYFPQLNMRPEGQHPLQKESAINASILFSDVVTNKEIVYFWLPAAAEAASVREIAKLAVYSLLQAHYLYQREHSKTAKSFLVIDEFQRMASGGFRIILEQARSYGIGAILANQTFQDLQTPDADLRNTVASNTRVKQTFSATDREQQDTLMRLGGELPINPGWWILGFSRHQFLRTRRAAAEVDQVNFITPANPLVDPFNIRITRNQVITVSDDPFASIFSVSRGAGYTQWSGFPNAISIRDFTITLDRYRELQATAWPEEDEQTITVTRQTVILTPEQIQGQREFVGYEEPEEEGMRPDEIVAPRPRRGPTARPAPRRSQRPRPEDESDASET